MDKYAHVVYTDVFGPGDEQLGNKVLDSSTKENYLTFFFSRTRKVPLVKPIC